MSRFTGFAFNAPTNRLGRAAHTLPGVPARDLDKRDVARLDDDAYEAVKAARMPNGEPLYEPVKRRKGKRAEDADAEDNAEASGESGDNEAVAIAGELPAEGSPEAGAPTA